MSLFNDTRIGTKLIGGFVAICIIMILIAIFGVANMNAIARNSDMMYEKALLPVKTLDAIDTEVLNVRVDILRYVLYPEERSDLKANISRSFRSINENLDQYLLNYAESSDVANFERLKVLFAELEPQYQMVIEIADAGNQTGAIEELAANSRRVEIRNEILSIIGPTIDKVTKGADMTRNDSNSAAFFSTLVFIVVTFGAALSSLGFGYYLSRNITVPLAEVVQVAGRIGHGDSGARISFTRGDEVGVLGTTLNEMGERINALVSDAKMLTRSAQKGELSVRSDPGLHEGDYRVIISEFNATLDSVTGPLNVAAEYVDRISKGDIPPVITDEYYGDFNEIKSNLNTCIMAVNLMIEDVNFLTEAAVRGNLNTRADASRHNGDFRRIVDGVNATLDAVIGPLNVAAEYVDRIAGGDIPDEITDPYYGDFRGCCPTLTHRRPVKYFF